jgi:hypothetical protein
MHLLNYNDRFARLETSACLKTTAQSSNDLELRPEPCAADADLFFFSKGRMTRLTDR